MRSKRGSTGPASPGKQIYSGELGARRNAVRGTSRARGHRWASAISINWGPWRDISAAASAELGVRLVSHGMGMIAPSEGALNGELTR
jgi:hypothetical protein